MAEIACNVELGHWAMEDEGRTTTKTKQERPETAVCLRTNKSERQCKDAGPRPLLRRLSARCATSGACDCPRADESVHKQNTQCAQEQELQGGGATGRPASASPFGRLPD